ncbi:MAG: hypothetical protein V3U71_09170 [Cocleimonas sp.]
MATPNIMGNINLISCVGTSRKKVPIWAKIAASLFLIHVRGFDDSEEVESADTLAISPGPSFE